MTNDLQQEKRTTSPGPNRAGRSSFLHVSDRQLVPGRVEVSRIGDLVAGPQTVLDRNMLESVLYLYLLKGAATVKLSDVGVRTLAPGDVLVVFPGRVATVELTAHANRLMLVALSGCEAVDASLKMGYWDLLYLNERYEGNYMAEIVDCFCEAPGHGRDPKVLGMVEQLLESVWLRARHGSSDGRIFNAVRTINRLPAVGLTTDAAATALGISRSKLNALFVDGLGIRPGEYLSRIVTARSLAALFWTDASVAQIAKKMGFSSTSAFAVFLRRRTGQTPTEFRKTPTNTKSFRLA